MALNEIMTNLWSSITYTSDELQTTFIIENAPYDVNFTDNN